MSLNEAATRQRLAEFVARAAGARDAMIVALERMSGGAVQENWALDVNLDGDKSYPVADALIARGVPFVFSTGYDKDRLLDGYRTFPVLQKPYHESELSDALAKLLTPKEPSVASVADTVALTSP